MPNGFQGSKEKWNEIAQPLLEIDDTVRKYASKRGMVIIENYHAWPSRAVSWSRSDIHRKMGVHLENETELTFAFGVVAWQDRGKHRYWRHEKLMTGISASDLKGVLRDLLIRGEQLLESWSEDDLEYGGDIAEL